MRLNPAAYSIGALLVLSLSSCAPPGGLHPTTTVAVAALPGDYPFGHTLGLGLWAADLSRDDTLHAVGLIDLERESYTVPLERLMGRAVHAGAVGARSSDGLIVILGQWRDTLPGGGVTFSTHDGSLVLAGHWAGPDSLVGRWSESKYSDGLEGSFVLVRCDRSAPSNHCMQPTRAPGH